MKASLDTNTFSEYLLGGAVIFYGPKSYKVFLLSLFFVENKLIPFLQTSGDNKTKVHLWTSFNLSDYFKLMKGSGLHLSKGFFSAKTVVTMPPGQNELVTGATTGT